MDFVKLRFFNGRIRLGEVLDLQGELMEVKMLQIEEFQIGEKLLCNFNGCEFDSVVLKVYYHHIYIYVPLFKEKFPHERRKIARIKVNQEATVNDYMSERIFGMPPEREVKLADLNVRGFGFISPEPLKIDSPYYLYMKLADHSIKTKIQIRNETTLPDNHFRYGSEIQAITKEDLFTLRKYILGIQLKTCDIQ